MAKEPDIITNRLDVSSFIENNTKSYLGNDSFLVGPSVRTMKLWKECCYLLEKEERRGGILKIDLETISSINSYGPGYVNRKLETIVGLQTNEPLKRAIKLSYSKIVLKDFFLDNRIRLSSRAKELIDSSNHRQKTFSDAVFSVYSNEILLLKKTGILSNLPDSSSREGLIGDYSRAAFYGLDYLISSKKEDYEEEKNNKKLLGEETIRLREELVEQISALEEIKEMAMSYGVDVSSPAKNAQEAIQWLYFAFLASIKEQDSLSINLGNISSFLDYYLEKDLKEGIINEEEAQELVDHLVMKLHLVRHLVVNEDSSSLLNTSIVEQLGGRRCDGKANVTRTTYRFLQTLYNLNSFSSSSLSSSSSSFYFNILWSKELPDNFKKFCAKVSKDTSALRYQEELSELVLDPKDNDSIDALDNNNHHHIGSSISYSGSRLNIAKALLLSLNEGREERGGEKIVSGINPLSGKILDYKMINKNFQVSLSYLLEEYLKALNIINMMHDKYYYERSQMAFINTNAQRKIILGLSGFVDTINSLSAIRYAKVVPIRDERGITTDFEINGDFPKYGSGDKRVEDIRDKLIKDLNKEIKKKVVYRDANILFSVTSSLGGKDTGATPSGRKEGALFASRVNLKDNKGKR